MKCNDTSLCRKTGYIGLLTLLIPFLSLQAANAAAPSAQQALRAALTQSNVPLHSAAHCESVARSANDKTVLDYATGTLALFAEEGASAHLDYRVVPVKNTHLWQVDLLFRGVYPAGREDSDNWTAGLRFKLDAKSQKIAPGSLNCIGSD